VRKSYEARRKRRKERGQLRSWKLKSMKAEAADEPIVKGKGRHGRDAGVNREEIDRERFMEVCCSFHVASLPKTTMFCLADMHWKAPAPYMCIVMRVTMHCLADIQGLDVESRLSAKEGGGSRSEFDMGCVQELEEDAELRSKIAIYKDPDYVHHDAMTDGDEEELPEIPLEELLDDLTALQIAEDSPQE
jgi:hypothetical protein